MGFLLRDYITGRITYVFKVERYPQNWLNNNCEKCDVFCLSGGSKQWKSALESGTGPWYLNWFYKRQYDYRTMWIEICCNKGKTKCLFVFRRGRHDFFLEILIDLNKLCFCSFIKNTCNFISSIGMGLTEEISTKIFFSEMFPVSPDVSIKKMTFIK